MPISNHLYNLANAKQQLPQLVFCSEREIDVFVQAYLEKNDIDMRIIRGSRCYPKDRLLQEWAAAMQFPYYFGNNWDAFNECINDLEWLHSRKIVVFITQVDQILQKDEKLLTLLTDILKSTYEQRVIQTIDVNRDNHVHELLIVFQSNPDAYQKVCMYFQNKGIVAVVFGEVSDDPDT